MSYRSLGAEVESSGYSLTYTFPWGETRTWPVPATLDKKYWTAWANANINGVFTGKLAELQQSIDNAISGHNAKMAAEYSSEWTRYQGVQRGAMSSGVVVYGSDTSPDQEAAHTAYDAKNAPSNPGSIVPTTSTTKSTAETAGAEQAGPMPTADEPSADTSTPVVGLTSAQQDEMHEVISTAESTSVINAKSLSVAQTVRDVTDVLKSPGVGVALALIPGVGVPMAAAAHVIGYALDLFGPKVVEVFARMAYGQDVATAFNQTGFTGRDVIGAIPWVGGMLAGKAEQAADLYTKASVAALNAAQSQGIAANVNLPSVDIDAPLDQFGTAVVTVVQTAIGRPLTPAESAAAFESYHRGNAYGSTPMSSAPPALDDLYGSAPTLPKNVLDGLRDVGATISTTSKIRKGLGADGSLLIASLSLSPFAAQMSLVLDGVVDGAGVDSNAVRAQLPLAQQAAYDVGRQYSGFTDRTAQRAAAVQAAAGAAVERWAGMQPGTAAPATLAVLANAAASNDTATLMRALGIAAAQASSIVKQASTAAAAAGAAFDLGVIAERADVRGAAGIIAGVTPPRSPEIVAAKQTAVASSASALTAVSSAAGSVRVAVVLGAVGIAAAVGLAVFWPQKK